MSIFKFRPRIPKTFQSWQVKDEYQSETTHNRWTNIDLIPTPESERNFTGKSFFAFWIAAAVNISAWTTGSANLANGLSAGETIGMILVGSILAGMISFICGEPGVRYHVGFPMMSRAAFGMYGSYFVVMLKCFVNFIYFGIQAYWGGLAMKVLLSCIFPSFQYMANTLPQSAAITTNQLIGFIIYIIVFTPMMLIHPSKLHKFLWVAFGCVLCTILGLFIWAVASNGGASLNTIQKVKISKAAAAINQLITLPLVLTVTAALGTFATSAVTNMYGKQIWQPITLLEFLLMDNYNAATRAGCFFAAFGFFLSQVSVNLVQNSVAAGMDLASLAPKWIDVKRGALIMCIVGYVINPWRFVNSPGNFITVLNSFGMFISPLAGINVVDL
ncbi:hypothetical protein Vi05172_g13577 [Venturia inaequalis]|nr:hypothetical protein Vi05172_g13577 [Venturia inaequalis]